MRDAAYLSVSPSLYIHVYIYICIATRTTNSSVFRTCSGFPVGDFQKNTTRRFRDMPEASQTPPERVQSDFPKHYFGDLNIAPTANTKHKNDTIEQTRLSPTVEFLRPNNNSAIIHNKLHCDEKTKLIFVLSRNPPIAQAE